MPWYKPEAARALWKLGRTLLADDEADNEDEAKIHLDKAMKLRREIAPDDDRKESELKDADWDSLVYFSFR